MKSIIILALLFIACNRDLTAPSFDVYNMGYENGLIDGNYFSSPVELVFNKKNQTVKINRINFIDGEKNIIQSVIMPYNTRFGDFVLGGSVGNLAMNGIPGCFSEVEIVFDKDVVWYLGSKEYHTMTMVIFGLDI